MRASAADNLARDSSIAYKEEYIMINVCLIGFIVTAVLCEFEQMKDAILVHVQVQQREAQQIACRQ